MNPQSFDYECIVIGGGPAGSTTGTLLAQQGHKTLIIEREKFPRFHIGESLMPETYWVFKRLGMLEKLKKSNFVKKYSVQFANAAGKESAPFYFDELNPHECSQTWQVLRSEFDEMMLNNAQDHGADVWQETNVTDVHMEADGQGGEPRATGVTAVRKDGTRRQLKCRVVIDATGANALISRRMGLRNADPNLRKAAVFAHFKGAQREPGKDEGATLVLSVENQKGWFWYIPLANDIMSVGVVGDTNYLIKGRDSIEKTLEEEIQRCPAVARRLVNAQRVSEVHVLSDFSFNSTRCAGNGWVLVGDAFTFLDPIYSSGVFLALKSGSLAADAVHEALLANDLSAERLSRWGGAYYEGVQRVRKIVYAYYHQGFSFGQFIRAHPNLTNNITELLIGDVFRPEVDAVFEPMSQWCKLPEPLKLASPAVEAKVAP